MISKIAGVISVLILATISVTIAFQPGIVSASEEVTTHFSGPTDPEEFESFFDAYIAEQMKTHHIPGVVFTMVKDGEVFFSKGYGYADLETQTPFDPEQTLLTTASLAKVFAAIGVLQLNEKGIIDINDDVRPYFTEFQPKTNFDEPLTFANLLTHTDGFEARMIGGAAQTQDELLPLGELLEIYAPVQIYPPGQYMTYGDYASNLGGYLTQEISETPFEQYMDENILLPLGMKNSTFNLRLTEDMLNRLEVGYEYQNGHQEPVPVFHIRYAPSGGMRTTAMDMNHFMLALLNTGENNGIQILNESTIDMLLFEQQFSPDPRMAGITYGLFEHFENGQRILLRDGDGFGTRSRMVLLPDHNTGFFINYNSGDNGLRFDIISAFLDHYYPVTGSNAPAPMEGYKQRASKFTGSYRPLQADTTTFGKSMYFFSQQVKVTAIDNGYLSIDGTGIVGEKSNIFGGFEGKSLWVEVEPLYFERVDGKGQLAFVQDESGRIIQMISGQGYHSTFGRLSWYETPTFQKVLIGFVLLSIISMIFFTFVIWPLSILSCKLRKQSIQYPDRNTIVIRIWITLVGSMLVFFLFRVIGVLYGGVTPNFVLGINEDMVESLNSVYLPVILAIPLPIFVVLAWNKSWWKVSTRVHYTMVTMAVFAGIWWAHYWNLLGFQM